MIENLYAYIYGDPRPRRTRDRLSLLIAFTSYVLGMAMGYGGVMLLTCSIAVLLVCQTITTILCCRQRLTVPEADIGSARLRLTTGASFAALVAIFLLAKPQVKGAVIEEQLRRISKDPDPDPVTLQRAHSLIVTANIDGIVLPPGPIQNIVAKGLTKGDAIKAVGDKVNSEAAARGIPTPIIGLMIWKTTQIGDITIAGMSGEGLNPEQWVPPGPVNLAPPDMVAFLGPIGSKATSPVIQGAGTISIRGKNHDIVIPLDNLHCKNIIFRECILAYSGAPLRLENVAFDKCLLKFGKSIACQKLAAELLGRPTATLTVS